MPLFDSWELTLPSDGYRHIDVTGLFVFPRLDEELGLHWGYSFEILNKCPTHPLLKKKSEISHRPKIFVAARMLEL